jgi:NYN domain
MIAYAIDNPPPATIILITNQQDYSYAVSILRLRRFRVVVITPPGTMVAQASVQLDWNSEVLYTPLEKLDSTNPSKYD